MSKTKEYIMNLEEQMNCDCEHEYDLCETCESDMEMESRYFSAMQSGQSNPYMN